MADHAEKRQTNPEAVEVFNLIASGRLPPAQGLCAVTDEPTWRLEGIAALLGIGLADLLEHVRSGPPRFQVTAPKGGPGEFRMLAK